LKNSIRGIRKILKISQEELANKCNVTRQTIHAIENDKYDPTLALAFKLSKNLKTPIEKLFTFEEEGNK
jgi:putative transcriptional regulator